MTSHISGLPYQKAESNTNHNTSIDVHDTVTNDTANTATSNSTKRHKSNTFHYDTYTLQPTDYIPRTTVQHNTVELPDTVEQYLYNVRQQAQYLPDVSVAHNNSVSYTTINEYKSDIPTSVQCIPELMYNDEFSTLLCQQYTILRTKIVEYCTVHKTMLSQYNKQHNIQLPTIKNWQQWLIYCLGTTDHTIHGHTVNLNILCQLQQITIKGIIKRMVSIINNDYQQRTATNDTDTKDITSWYFNQQCAIWLYALFAVLDVPLTPDTSSDLCQLYRTLASIRSLHTIQDINHTTVMYCNILMCIIDTIFHQGNQ